MVNTSNSPVDPMVAIYREWATLPSWTPEEAICLLLAIDPAILQNQNEHMQLLRDVLLDKSPYYGFLDFAKREIRRGVLKKKSSSPTDWIKWARKRLTDYQLPEELEAAVSMFAVASEKTKRGRPRIAQETKDKIREAVIVFDEQHEGSMLPATKLARHRNITDAFAPDKHKPSLSVKAYRKTYDISLRAVEDLIRKTRAEKS